MSGIVRTLTAGDVAAIHARTFESGVEPLPQDALLCTAFSAIVSAPLAAIGPSLIGGVLVMSGPGWEVRFTVASGRPSVDVLTVDDQFQHFSGPALTDWFAFPVWMRAAQVEALRCLTEDAPLAGVPLCESHDDKGGARHGLWASQGDALAYSVARTSDGGVEIGCGWLPPGSAPSLTIAGPNGPSIVPLVNVLDHRTFIEPLVNALASATCARLLDPAHGPEALRDFARWARELRGPS